MGVLLARIDDRLIHGQVVVGWVRALHANHLVVISNQVARAERQKALFRMVVPPELKVSTISVEQAALLINSGELLKDDVLLLFSCPRDVSDLLDKGVFLPSINVGGLHYEEGKIGVSKAVYIGAEDMKYFKILASKGIDLEIRAASGDEKTSLLPYLQE